jgi:hypothetical protein
MRPGDQPVHTASHEATGLRLKDEAVEKAAGNCQRKVSRRRKQPAESNRTRASRLVRRPLIKVQSALRVPA